MVEMIKEENILEFKALTLTKRIFDQMREVKGVTIEVIGWANVGIGEYFIGKLGNTLVKERRIDIFDQMAHQIGGERIKDEAEKLDMGPSQYLNTKLDQYRDNLPQIFIR